MEKTLVVIMGIALVIIMISMGIAGIYEIILMIKHRNIQNWERPYNERENENFIPSTIFSLILGAFGWFVLYQCFERFSYWIF